MSSSNLSSIAKALTSPARKISTARRVDAQLCTVSAQDGKIFQSPKSVQAKVPNNIGKRCPVELLGSGQSAQWAKVGPPPSYSSFLGQWGACPSESLRIPQRTSRINSKKPAKVKYFFAAVLLPSSPVSGIVRSRLHI